MTRRYFAKAAAAAGFERTDDFDHMFARRGEDSVAVFPGSPGTHRPVVESVSYARYGTTNVIVLNVNMASRRQRMATIRKMQEIHLSGGIF